MRDPLTKRFVRSRVILKTTGKAIWRREKRTYILDMRAGAEDADSYAGDATASLHHDRRPQIRSVYELEQEVRKVCEVPG